MLFYDRIDRNKGIDLAQSNNSKKGMIFYYWLFNHGFKFQDYICNGSQDLTMFSVNISNITIVIVENIHYLCIIDGIRKSQAINLLENSVLDDRGYYKKSCENFGLTY